MKKLFIAFALTLIASASQASYLWWELDTAELDKVSGYATELSLSSSDIMARVVQVDSDGKKTGTYSDGEGFLGPWYTARNQQVDMETVFGTSASSYSYYVEIIKISDSSVIGYNTQAQSYTDLQGAGSITTGFTPQQSVIWHGGSGEFKATPEPTSAMLMLIGVAGLALRRKQRKA